MTFFLGNYGNVRLRRGTSLVLGTLQESVIPDDISLNLNRINVDNSIDNLLTGDRLIIETTDSRGLEFIAASSWTSGTVEKSFSAYVNVNAAGGLRLYPTFQSAVNNVRSDEVSLQSFTGNAIPVSLSVRDVAYNVLGNVTNYEFNTARDAIDTTSLQDKYKQQYNAGLLSGSGRIECGFDYKQSGVKETPLFMLQLIQRLDLGSAFDIALYLTDDEVDPNVDNVFYLATAVVTGAGISVEAKDYISATLDFVTTGEIRLVVGKPSQYLLKEDDDRLQLETSVDFLLQEETD